MIRCHKAPFISEKVKKKIRRYILKIEYWVAGYCYYIFRVFPLQNKIVTSAFRGRRYGDNPKYIIEELHRINPDTDIVWLKNRHFTYELPSYVRSVSFYSHIRKAYEISTARVWVYSHKLEDNIKKRRGQIFIETWHGGLGLKKIEQDIEGEFPDKKETRELENTVRLADLFISNSDHLTRIYRSAFNYEGPIWKCGYPKNDIFFRSALEIRHKVRQTYGLADDVKILLYAPTFRDTFEKNGFDSRPYAIDLERVRLALSQRFDGNWEKIMRRWHPVMAEKMEQNTFGRSENVIDVTAYPDMQELILASDALITDYSSCMFDAAITEKPCFIYAADFDAYAGGRGTYYMLHELPFPWASDCDGLIENILTFDSEEYRRKWTAFAKRTGFFETGHAGYDIAALINACLTGDRISWTNLITQ